MNIRNPFWALLALAALVAAGIIVAMTDNADASPDVDAPAVFSVLPEHCLVDAETAEVKPGKCAVTWYGYSRPEVVVWGDSHATQLLPAIKAATDAAQMSLTYFTQGGCPPMNTTRTDSCSERAKKAKTYIANRPNARVILAAAWSYYWFVQPEQQVSVNFSAGIRPLFKWFRETAPNPWAIVGPQPFRDLSRTDLYFDDVEAFLRNQGADVYYDIEPVICATPGGAVFYDEYHLDVRYTAQYAPVFQ